jgi:hypothetical protein
MPKAAATATPAAADIGAIKRRVAADAEHDIQPAQGGSFRDGGVIPTNLTGVFVTLQARFLNVAMMAT